MSDQLAFVDEYLSEDQKREIAIDVWRKMCAKACEGDAERIMANIAYHVAAPIVDECLGEDAKDKISARVVEIISQLTEFSVFRRPDAWDREPSPAYRMLMQAVVDNRELVEEKVRGALHNLSKREALEILKSGKILINPGK